MFDESERIWCAVKKGKRDLSIISLTRALVVRDIHNDKMVHTVFLVLQGLVESGQPTHLGRT
jgi:hypothetical protein